MGPVASLVASFTNQGLRQERLWTGIGILHSALKAAVMLLPKGPQKKFHFKLGKVVFSDRNSFLSLKIKILLIKAFPFIFLKNPKLFLKRQTILSYSHQSLTSHKTGQTLGLEVV